jgi:hypothetical protein
MKTIVDNIKAVLVFLLFLAIWTGVTIYFYHKYELKHAGTVNTPTVAVIEPQIAPTHVSKPSAVSTRSKPDSSVIEHVGNVLALNDSIKYLQFNVDSLKVKIASMLFPRQVVFLDTTKYEDSVCTFFMIQQTKVTCSFAPDSISKDLFYKLTKLTLKGSNSVTTISPSYNFWDWISAPCTLVLSGITIVAILIKTL